MQESSTSIQSGHSSGTSEESHDLAYDLALIAIFAMLLFYVISSSVIAKKHVSIKFSKFDYYLLFLDWLATPKCSLGRHVHGPFLHHLSLRPIK